MDSGFLLTSGGTAILSAIIIQALKKSNIISFIGTEKSKGAANLCFSVFIAFITSLGIGYKYDGASGTLILTGLTAAGLLHGIWHWFVQWVGQHLAYKQIVVPAELQAATIDVLNQLLDHLKLETTPVSVEKINPTIGATK